MLPAGDLFKHQQADFIAAIQEMRALRIMRGPHDVAAEVKAQDFGVAFLRPAALRIAGIGEGLVPVQPAQLQRPTVQMKALRGPLNVAKAEAERQAVGCGACLAGGRCPPVPPRDIFTKKKGDLGEIERRGFGRPERHAVETGDHDLADAGSAGDFKAIGVTDHHLGGAIRVDQDAHRFLIGQRVRRFDLGRSDMPFGQHRQPGIAVEARIGQIVDAAAKGRDIRVLGSVDPHGQAVRAGPQMRGQVGGDRGIAVAVAGDFRAVQPDRRVGHGRVEPQFDDLARRRVGGLDHALIGEGALVGAFVEIAQRQVHRVMGQGDRRAGQIGAGPIRVETGGKGPAGIDAGVRAHGHHSAKLPSAWRQMGLRQR